MEQREYVVSGMSCGHCEDAVRGELAGVAGVGRVEVSATTGRLTLGADGTVDDAAVLAAVDEAGYQAVRV